MRAGVERLPSPPGWGVERTEEEKTEGEKTEGGRAEEERTEGGRAEERSTTIAGQHLLFTHVSFYD